MAKRHKLGFDVALKAFSTFTTLPHLQENILGFVSHYTGNIILNKKNISRFCKAF